MSALISSASLSASQTERLRELILTWRSDPARYVTDVFGVTPEPWQAEALRLLAEQDRVSIRSGHGVGKSALDAWAIFWFLSCYYPAKIPCTAPTAHQLEDVLWAELAKWHRKMPAPLQGQFEVKSDRVVLTAAPNESFAVARTARKENPEALQGFHADHLMFVIDEASGVEEIIFEVAEGALSTPGAKVLMTANPTRTSGYFYDSHHRMRRHWATMRVSCEESSRVSREYIEQMAEKYGRDSNIYRVRVLGEFPTSDDDVVIPLELCTAAVGRDVEPSGEKIIWGVDVARFGDDRTTLAKRCGNRQLEPVKAWQGKDLMQTVGLIVLEYEQAGKEKPDEIVVDSIGIGAGVVDRLKEMGLPVRGVNVAEAPAVRDRYLRLRDELWFRGREWLAGRDVKLCDDDELIGELTTVKYSITSSGKLKVESKDEMKKRGLRSPDKADAWLLTFGTSDTVRKKRKSNPGAGLLVGDPGGSWML